MTVSETCDKPAFAKLKIFRKLAEQQHISIVAFGSSNTQRRLSGMTWFDYVELGFKNQYSKNRLSHTAGFARYSVTVK